MRAPIGRRHVHVHPPQRDAATCVQRPNATILPLAPGLFFGPFERPGSRQIKGRQALLPLPWPAGRSGHLRDPLGSDRRDANTLAPNGPKARTLRCARQELVRVPESNTKYGGKTGITGVGTAPVVEASISESSEIPNRKNLCLVMPGRLRPAVHRAGIFLVPGIASVGLT
jgi:hypothetical protein